MSSAHAIHTENVKPHGEKKSGFASIKERIRKYFKENAYYFATLGAAMSDHPIAVSKLIDEEGFAK